MKYESNNGFSDEDILEEELVETYKLLHTQWKESCMVVEK